MVSSGARAVDDYLQELPSERREVVAAVREEIRRNLPPGYVEGMNWGMIAYEVPLERYPDTYNRQPLAYAALAAQKNYYAVYLNCVYLRPDGEARVQEEFERAGKKLDMGKSCVRFRNLEDLPLAVIGKLISETPVDDFIQLYEASRRK
jgi:uncharacterized protein YdhG (YjbR/CyaY superfamily)